MVSVSRKSVFLGKDRLCHAGCTRVSRGGALPFPVGHVWLDLTVWAWKKDKY
ncbi:hypothetical protein Geu3261_0058_010 [Komagataeibacter europaeus NBRC 3261]|uniref:Uncharacterized protein n=1 Tax=Komagataeibacter europaeus NBRC 3261 TaxID=1234669 RepID=A0A0D6PY94_KOMEU|nr:hypothetical protein Geu3261_0058_010 [Komagataeibacter europaeus NBRC 3261]